MIRASTFLSASAVIFAVAACTRPPAGPALTGIAPDRGPADRDVAVTITGTGLGPVLTTDFSRGSSSSLDTAVTAHLGTNPLTNVHLNSDGSIAATVPAGLTPGSYDLTVVAPGGSNMSMPGAYRVLSPSEAGELVALYKFDPIAPQQVGVPFSVTITALDSTMTVVDGFAGEATLTDTTGTVVPHRIGPFAAGVWTGLVEVRAVGTDALTVTDDQSHLGTSNTFTVSPGNGDRLVFTTPPRTATAGQCSSAITVQRVDATAAPSPAMTAIPLTLTPSPAAGFQLFSDPGCTQALTASIAAGMSDTTFYVSSTRAGPVQLAASAPGLSGATQLETINPGPPVKVVFTTADPTLNSGTCSSDVTLQSRDSLDNPSPVSADTAVMLDAPGLGLFAPGLCASAVSSVTILNGATTASFDLLGSAAGTFTVTATTATLGSAMLQVRVMPAGFPTQLQIVSVAQTLDVGTCSGPLAVQSQDAAGNPVINPGALTVNLSAAPAMGFTFYSDATCMTPVTTTTLGVTTSTSVVYFLGNQAGAITLTASTAGLQSGVQTETLRAGAATSLSFTSAPQMITAGTCSGELRVGLLDALGNAATAAMPATVTLAAGAPFFSDALCMMPVTTFDLMPGDASGRLFMKPTVARTETVSAASPGLGPAQQDETVGAAAPAALVFISAPQTVGIGACSAAATAQVQDAFGNASPLAAAGTATLSAAPSAGFTFYSDPSCATAVTSVPVLGAATWFFKGSSLGTVMMTVASTGLTSAQQNATLVAGAPAKLAFTTPPRTLTAGTCSAAITVAVQDATGNASPVSAPTAIALAPVPAGLSTFSDPTCMTAAAGLNLATGASSGTFYVSGTVAAPYTVTASSIGLISASQVETLTAANADRLAFVTPARSASAGACSAAVTIARRDPFGNDATGAAITATLTANPAAGFTLYSDAACTMAVTQVSIAVSLATFYFKGTIAQSVLVTASSAPLTSASQTEMVTAAAAPTQLVFTTPPRTVTAGGCSPIASVQSQDSFSNPRAVAANTTVTLAGATTFYSDSGCTMAVTQVTLLAGMNTVSFYFHANTAPSMTATATAAGLNPATQVETVNAAAPGALVFVTAPQTLSIGTCSAVATVEARDAFGNPSAPGANQTVTLAGPGVSFFAAAGCGGAATGSVTLTGGMTRTSFYFKGTTSGMQTISATVATWTPATQGETFTAGAATKLVFTNAPPTVAAGACSGALTVEARDAFNNTTTVSAATTVNLTAVPAAGFTFFSNAGCGTSTTSVTMPNGASNVSFWVKGTTASTVAVTAAAAGLTAANQNVTVTAAAPSKIVFTTPARTAAAGQCSQVLTVQLQDAFNNVATAGSAVALTLSAAPPTGFTFDSNAACTMGTGTATVAAGMSQVSFYFSGTRAGAVTATVSGAGLTSANQGETVSPGGLSSFSWASIPSPRSLNTAFGVTVTALDAFGNTATGFAGTATLSMAPAGTVQCTSACTNASTTDVFAAGVWSGTVTLSTLAAVGANRTLAATQGASNGTSNAFTVSGPAARSPPIARFTWNNAVVNPGGSVTFDASASSDYQTASSQLQVTWDPESSGGALPWTPWTTTKTFTHTYNASGVFRVRLVVKDTDGDVDYVEGFVYVVRAGHRICRVTTNSDVDDGASNCTSSLGTDGKLSLSEAVRLIDNTKTNIIYFANPMTITSTGHYSLTGTTQVYAQPGVIIEGKTFQASAGSTVDLWGVEISGATEVLAATGNGANVGLHMMNIHDGLGVQDTLSNLTVEQTHMGNCTGPCIEHAGNNTGTMTIKYSELRSSPSQSAVLLSGCQAGSQVLDMFSNTVAGFTYGVQAQCNGTTLIRENTFDSVGTGVSYAGGTGHVLVDNIFTGNTTSAASCGSATFTTRSYHQLFGNASSGCIGGDPNTLTSDPQYAFQSAGDYRLGFGSPAINSALDTGLDVCLGFPANFEGAAPDRGGRESY